MEEEGDLDLGLEDELEKALEMDEGTRHVSHDLPFSGASQNDISPDIRIASRCIQPGTLMMGIVAHP